MDPGLDEGHGMKKRTALLAAFRGWRARRRYRKGKVMKDITKSRTTQNVAAGSAASGGLAYGLLAALRSAAPGLLPWDEVHDVAVAVVATTVLAPLLSRIIAFVRTPEKQ